MSLISRFLACSVVLVCAVPLAAQQPVSGPAPLTLREAIQISLERGTTARAAKAQRDAGRYRNQAFNSRLLPQLSLSGDVPSYNRSIIPVLQPDGTTLFRRQELTNAALTATLSQKLPFTGGDFFVSSSLARLSLIGAQTQQSWTATPFSFGLKQDILRPNTLAWDRRAQRVQAELNERQYLEAREDISLQTVNLFIDVYAARVALDNATKNAAVNDTLFTLNRGRFEVAKIGENDLLQSELALLRSRNVLDGAKLEYERAVAALRLGLGFPDGTPLAVVLPPEVPVFEADSARAIAEALANRATVSDAELQEVLARRRMSEARFASGLSATVQASYGFNATGSQASLAYQDLLEARQVKVSVQFPFWQWGAHDEGIHAAEADRDRAENQALTNLGQLKLDAKFAALQLDQARRSLQLSTKADTVAGKRFDVAYNRYVIGRIAIDNLYQAQGEKDQARTQFVQALRSYWQAHYRLRRTTLYDFEAGERIR